VNNLSIDLGASYRDVISIELVKAVIPNPDGKQNFVIKITGIEVIRSGNAVLNGAFCTVDRTASATNPIVYQGTGSCNALYTHYFSQPSKLQSLQISIYNPDGTLAVLGIAVDFLLIFILNTLNQPSLPVL
jgi:hypothetical protein